MLSTNKVIHEAYENLEEVCWMPFPPFGIEDNYHGWYYAGDEMYVIHDIMVDTFVFIRARSANEAYEKYMERLSEAMKAGARVEEEE